MSQAAPAYDLGNDGWHAVINRVQRPALLIGAVGLLLTLIGLFIKPESGFRSYIWAYVYWTAIPLGSLGLLMIQHMTGGTWGLVLRRILEASAWLLLLMALFSVPLLIAVLLKRTEIYPWLPDAAGNKMLGHHANKTHIWFKNIWLDQYFFVLRTAVYFTITGFLAVFLYGWSGREDRSGSSPLFAFRARQVAAPGILLFGLCVTFFFIDVVMTLDPGWYSTMFGVLYLIGGGLVTMAFCILVLRFVGSRVPAVQALLTPALLNDLGNLTFAFLMLWAYTNFSQFLIMWSGNIAEEMPYYYVRNKGSWGFIALFIVLFHFFIPFFLLIWRKVKRDMRLLAMVAVGIMIVRSVDLFWIVKPMFIQRQITLNLSDEAAHGAADASKTAHGQAADGRAAHGDPHSANTGANKGGSMGPVITKFDVPVEGVFQGGLHWTDLPAMAGIGGIWVAAFAWKLKQRPLLPPNDPRLARIAAAGHH